MFLGGSDSYWLQRSDENENWRNMIYWFNKPETVAEFLGVLELSFSDPLLCSFCSRFCLEMNFFVFSYLLQTLPNTVILTGCRITIKSELKEKDSLLPLASSFLQCFLLYINLGLLLCCSRGFDVAFVYRSKVYLFVVVFLEVFRWRYHYYLWWKRKLMKHVLNCWYFASSFRSGLRREVTSLALCSVSQLFVVRVNLTGCKTMLNNKIEEKR